MHIKLTDIILEGFLSSLKSKLTSLVSKVKETFSKLAFGEKKQITVNISDYFPKELKESKDAGHGVYAEYVAAVSAVKYLLRVNANVETSLLQDFQSLADSKYEEILSKELNKEKLPAAKQRLTNERLAGENIGEVIGKEVYSAIEDPELVKFEVNLTGGSDHRDTADLTVKVSKASEQNITQLFGYSLKTVEEGKDPYVKDKTIDKIIMDLATPELVTSDKSGKGNYSKVQDEALSILESKDKLLADVLRIAIEGKEKHKLAVKQAKKSRGKANANNTDFIDAGIFDSEEEYATARKEAVISYAKGTQHLIDNYPKAKDYFLGLTGIGPTTELLIGHKPGKGSDKIGTPTLHSKNDEALRSLFDKWRKGIDLTATAQGSKVVLAAEGNPVFIINERYIAHTQFRINWKAVKKII